jgi:flagellar assembly protein FliH
MTAVIHSAKLLKEPVTLFRNVPARTPTAASLSPLRVPHDAGTPSATTLPAAAQPQIAQISYEEYKQRFAAELDLQRAEAREQGLLDGREAGLAKAVSEQSSLLMQLAGVVRSARERTERGIEDLTDLGVEIVFEASCKILGEALTQREGVIAAVREAVRRVRDRSRLTLRVSPSDCELVRGNLAAILDGPESGQVEVLADERVELGGCLIETPSGNLDGRLEVQLASLRRTLLAARSESSNGDSPK